MTSDTQKVVDEGRRIADAMEKDGTLNKNVKDLMDRYAFDYAQAYKGLDSDAKQFRKLLTGGAGEVLDRVQHFFTAAALPLIMSDPRCLCLVWKHSLSHDNNKICADFIALWTARFDMGRYLWQGPRWVSQNDATNWLRDEGLVRYPAEAKILLDVLCERHNYENGRQMTSFRIEQKGRGPTMKYRLVTGGK